LVDITPRVDICRVSTRLFYDNASHEKKSSHIRGFFFLISNFSMSSASTCLSWGNSYLFESWYHHSCYNMSPFSSQATMLQPISFSHILYSWQHSPDPRFLSLGTTPHPQCNLRKVHVAITSIHTKIRPATTLVRTHYSCANKHLACQKKSELPFIYCSLQIPWMSRRCVFLS